MDYGIVLYLVAIMRKSLCCPTINRVCSENCCREALTSPFLCHLFVPDQDQDQNSNSTDSKDSQLRSNQRQYQDQDQNSIQPELHKSGPKPKTIPTHNWPGGKEKFLRGEKKGEEGEGEEEGRREGEREGREEEKKREEIQPTY